MARPATTELSRKEYMKAWRLANKDRINAARRAWYASNPEYVEGRKAYFKNYYARNSQKIAQSASEWAKQNSPRRAEIRRKSDDLRRAEWEAQNPVKMAAYQIARVLGAGVAVVPSALAEAKAEQIKVVREVRKVRNGMSGNSE